MHFLYKIDRMKEKELLEETMELTVQINEKSARLQTLDQKIQIQFQPAITQLQRESIQLYTDIKGNRCKFFFKTMLRFLSGTFWFAIELDMER